MTRFRLRVNGIAGKRDDMPLLWALPPPEPQGNAVRLRAGPLRRMHGAPGGAASPFCVLPIRAVGDRAITTIEGLGARKSLSTHAGTA